MTEHFAVTSMNQFIQPDGYILEFYTDRECRLFLRESRVKPVVHMEPALRRGMVMHTDPRFCFVSWQVLPQQEDGDTTTHSFYYKWTPKQTDVWFYLVGSVNGEDSPSTSPIMHLPCNPVIPVQTKYQYTSGLVYTSITWNEPYAFGFKCPEETILGGFQLPIAGLNQPGKVTFRFYDTEPVWGKPNNILAETVFPFIPDKRSKPPYGELYFPMGPIRLIPETYYAISLWGDPDKPDTPTIAWKWWNTDPVDPTEWEFRGKWVDGVFNWYYYGVRYFGYRSWWNIPYFQPGVPTPLQIPA